MKRLLFGVLLCVIGIVVLGSKSREYIVSLIIDLISFSIAGCLFGMGMWGFYKKRNVPLD